MAFSYYVALLHSVLKEGQSVEAPAMPVSIARNRNRDGRAAMGWCSSLVVALSEHIALRTVLGGSTTNAPLLDRYGLAARRAQGAIQESRLALKPDHP